MMRDVWMKVSMESATELSEAWVIMKITVSIMKVSLCRKPVYPLNSPQPPGNFDDVFSTKTIFREAFEG